MPPFPRVGGATIGPTWEKSAETEVRGSSRCPRAAFRECPRSFWGEEGASREMVRGSLVRERGTGARPDLVEFAICKVLLGISRQ